jgi:hypothetical protein
LLAFYYPSRTQRASDSPNNQGIVSGIEGAVLNASLRMIMLNGSAPHTNVITNFRLSDVSSNENGTMTYTSSLTVIMPEAPIVDVSTTFKVSSDVISIFPDASSVDGHFGETPIYTAISIGHEKDHRGPAYFTFQGPTDGPSN